jgi:transcription elongation factor Elf1
MSKQIDELMELADVYATTTMWHNSDQNRATLREALEAALKPGEPDHECPMCNHRQSSISYDCNNCGRSVQVEYSAPPAQTPPRLTEAEVNEIYNKWVQGNRDGTTFTGAIQDAVRRQSGVRE